jgi:hypothetical protein
MKKGSADLFDLYFLLMPATTNETATSAFRPVEFTKGLVGTLGSHFAAAAPCMLLFFQLSR